MVWTSTSSPNTTWQAVSPGATITNTLLTLIQTEVASAQAAQAAAETAETNAEAAETNAASSAAAAASSASGAVSSAVDASSFATQAQSAAASLTPIPTGGSTGQSLVKNSATDYDYAWATVAGGGGSLTDGDYGDITVSGSGTVWTVDSGAVLFSEIGSTPTTLAGYGITDAAALTHTHAAGDVTSGTMATARLGSGTASASNFLRGDQSWSAVSFANLTSTPTTLAGYGITDAAAASHTHTFASLTSKPTTLAGYGITDAAASSHVHAAADITSGTVATARLGGGTASASTFLRGDQAWSAVSFANLTSTPTTLAGYGITDAAALSHTHAAADVTSGTFADARISETSVTQHEAALSIAGSQVDSGTVAPARLGSGTSITTKFLRGDSTWQTISGGGDALTANSLAQFAATTSAELRGVLSDETGTGAAVFANSPVLTTPNIGTATGSVSGNAGTATALQTARTINGTSFDGTADITVAAAAGTLAGATLAAGVTASSLTSVGTLTGLTMGGTLAMADQLLTRSYLQDYAEVANALGNISGTVAVDYEEGNVAFGTLTGNITTFSITNPPASGRVGTITLVLIQDGTGSRTVTWGASVLWPGGTAPTLSGASGVDVVTLVTLDGGTTWLATSQLDFS
jgi:hypothetical protein